MSANAVSQYLWEFPGKEGEEVFESFIASWAEKVRVRTQKLSQGKVSLIASSTRKGDGEKVALTHHHSVIDRLRTPGHHFLQILNEQQLMSLNQRLDLLFGS